MAGEKGRKAAPAVGFDSLTPREKDILRLIVEGSRNKEIAAVLSLDRRTVESHRLRLRKKLNARTTADLVRIALQRGLA